MGPLVFYCLMIIGQSEFENITNFLYFFFQDNVEGQVYSTGLNVKIELSIGRDVVFIILFKTVAHAVLLLSLDPSV